MLHSFRTFPLNQISLSAVISRWTVNRHTEHCFSCLVFVAINLCLPPGHPVTSYSCDLLEVPDVTIGSCTEQLTAVRIHKQGDWLLLRFISYVIDCCWHNSCQWCKWWLTNDRVGSGGGGNYLGSLWSHTAIIPVSFSVPFYCHTQSLSNR